MLSLLLTIAGHGKDLREVLVFVRRVKLVHVFFGAQSNVCVWEHVLQGVCASLQGSVSRVQGVWETLRLYTNGTHRVFFMHLKIHTHACAPVQPHCRSSLRIETNRLIHATQGLNVIKIYRSGSFSPVTDWHSSTFGSGLGTLIRGTSKWVSNTFQWNWDETCISKVRFQKWFNFQ